MAVITDPDLLSRYDVIYGTKNQTVSIYPVGDTQRGTTYTDTFVASNGTLSTGLGSFTGDGVIEGDVVAIIDGPNAGHYYVDASPTASTITLVEIDSGSAGAVTTSLTVAQRTFDAVADVDPSTDNITITGHSYVTGDAVVYRDGGGTAPTGLTSGNRYFVIYVDANNIRLASSFANAEAGTHIDITADGVGVAHTIDDRILVGIFNNGANTSEQINGNDTSGLGDGDVLDGITLQAIYSNAKDEWRIDSLITDISGDYNDDLIRHEYPFEAITAEQFEIGGGAAHDNWTWFNDYTRKKVRTAGWAEKNSTNALDNARYTGIITLGTLDADAQVYYQQTSVTTAKTDFTFLGPVNEAILIYEDTNTPPDGTPESDFTTFLRLFVRKKGRTYAGSEIADIGVTTIQTIVNRFPLSQVVDAAITLSDANLEAESPYKNTTQVSTNTDGSKNSTEDTFTSLGSTFQTVGVQPGDVLQITSGSEQGFYEILAVNSETELQVLEVEAVAGNDFTFSTGWASTESSLSFEILSTVRVNQVTGLTGAGTGIINVTPATAESLGELTDTVNSPFASVIAGDILVLRNSTGNDGVYKVVDSNFDANAADPTATTIYVNTIDQPFPGTRETDLDYQINQAGMYLQFKEETVDTINSGSGLTQVDFNQAGKTITLTGDTWSADVGPGTMIVVSGSTSNNGRYTVLERTSDTVVTLISTDVLATESDTVPTTVISVREGFKRDIGGTTFAYRWRVLANNGTLSDVYQFIQKQLRLDSDIDEAATTSIGNITDLLMSFATPTGTTFDMYIDDLNAADINNITQQDHSGTSRNFPFTASGSLVFNSNLTNDSTAKYWLFFTNDDAGDNLGRDYGTQDAILVEDTDGVQIQGDVNGAGNHTGQSGTVDAANNTTIPFTYDYDGNVQRGLTSAATTAPVTLVAIGTDTAQFVVVAGTITRSTGITISATAALERNYLTGSV